MKHRWIAALGIQAAEMLAAGFVQAFSYGVHPALYAALLWAGMPLAGLLTACAAVNRGLNNYAAWIAPPACLYAAHFAVWGYSPSAGAALLTALAALVGAAAGEVLVRRSKRNH